MARIEVTMPKMGESIMEGTVVEWVKKVGDAVEQDETLLEIATDKVDSEVPAPDSGILIEILVEEGETVDVGEPIAILETDPDAAKASLDGKTPEDNGEDTPETESEDPKETSAEDSGEKPPESDMDTSEKASAEDSSNEVRSQDESTDHNAPQTKPPDVRPAHKDSDSSIQKKGSDGRFFSPLVRAIAKEEGLSQEELESLEGSGKNSRVTKQDILDYVKLGKPATLQPGDEGRPDAAKRADGGAGAGKGSEKTGKLRKPGDSGSADEAFKAGELTTQWSNQNVQIIKMDRMRKVIAEHMIRSKQTSAHVTTFGEADVTRLVRFRDRHKDSFLKDNGFKLTFTPFFVQATIQALREFPLVNSSVDGESIVVKRDINYGIAVALGESGTGGLIVPVIKNAGDMNILGLAKKTHELAKRARSKQLSPDDLVGGTFTLTNYGSVGNLMGTPIINQPQVAIFGTGIIQKRPVVVEVDGSDTIAIRHMVYLSMSYDHRIIDGAMGGAFVQRVKQLLEDFDVKTTL